MYKRIALALAAAALTAAAGCGGNGNGGPTGATGATGNTGATASVGDAAAAYQTATPIKHIVVIFDENESFDHYFGTYPEALNPSGEPSFYAVANTPVVNGYTVALLDGNPNAANAANNGASQDGNAAPVTSGGAVNPFRLDRALAGTADQDHNYADEEKAFDGGAMDLFPLYTGAGGTVSNKAGPASAPTPYNTDGLTMGYFDGNTVTALWNYAQNFALNDNSFGTTFGPTLIGGINLVSGQTDGAVDKTNGAAAADLVSDGAGGYTVIADVDPYNETCSTSGSAQILMQGKNIGDLLNATGISWGFFKGGFDLTAVNSNGTTGCKRSTTSTITGANKKDYSTHQDPFQYYATTCNPTHTRPASVAVIGTSADTAATTNGCGSTTTTANHQYDLNDFTAAVSAGNFPAVSFLKGSSMQNGHPGYSDPLDEQQFIVGVLNFLQQRQEWSSTLVVIAYDDSDGWYDHVTHVVNGSNVSGVDAAICNGSGVPAASLLNWNGTAVAQGRCGYGPRLPLLVISPYAKTNYVDNTLTDQTSIIRFIEDNWLASARIPGSYDAMAGSIQGMLNFTKTSSNPTLFLDPGTGLPQ
jgi:phospholipase C